MRAAMQLEFRGKSWEIKERETLREREKKRKRERKRERKTDRTREMRVFAPSIAQFECG